MLRKYYSKSNSMMSNIMRLATGLVILFTAGIADAANITYTYDNLHRLIRADYNNGMVVEYTYDAAGNRKREVVSNSSINAAPALSYSSEAGYVSDGINPDSGTTATTFNYKVIYTDANNNPPSFIKVHINGDTSGVSMSLDTTAASILRDEIYANGEQYYYTTLMTTGAHNYYFDASDGIDTARLPSFGTFSGPNVSDPNQPPIANNQSVTTAGNTPVSITLTGSDPEMHALTFVVVTAPSYGMLSGTPPNLTYTPNINFAGTDSFTFKVNDGELDSNIATVSITVNPVVDTTPPVTTASPAGGTYTSAQIVSLSANESATIYYTTDGTTPTTSSSVYSGTINIWKTTTLKFFAVDNAGNSEAVKAEIYTIMTGPFAEYYDNSDLTGLVLSRADSAIDFDWGTGSPNPAIGADTFSVRWTGKLQADFNEAYTFSVITDDGVRLWIDGHLVLDYWKNGGASTSDTLDLTAGLHDIKVEYYEDTGTALIQLYWSSLSTPYAIIPNDHLYLPDGAGSSPVLSWAGDAGYITDGVDPETGGTAAIFTYRIKYADADGDLPMNGFPRVHILKAGKEIAGSPFGMNYESGNYTSGAIYTFSTTLPAGTDYTYYFDAKDSTGLQAVAAPAIPTPVAPLDAPDVGSVSIQLPQTGQTTCYAAVGTVIPCAGTGQDGDIQAGVPWPNPRFIDNGDGTVTDKLTGLMWTKDGNAPGPAACSPATAKTWQGALDYAACLNTNSYLGYSDWHLPNINELESLVNAEQGNAAYWLNTQGFSNVQSMSYWSSTSIIGSAISAYVVSMLNGNIGANGKPYGSYAWPVRTALIGTAQLWVTGQTTCYDSAGTLIACAGTGQDGDVRAGVYWPIPRFTDNNNGTVTDNLSGLMWAKDSNLPVTYKTWQEALNYVAGMNAGTYPNFGYSDWRLPNRKEFHSLKDFSQYGPLLPSGHSFLNVSGWPGYWSSTSYNYLDSKGSAWMDYLNGTDIPYKNGYGKVWPVRSGQVGTSVHSILGTVMENGAGLGGVTMTLSGSFSATTTTAADGTYSFTGLADGSYMITPTLDGYSFTPPNQPVTISGSSMVDINFTATKIWFEDSDPAVSYTGTWNLYSCNPCKNGALKYTSQIGARAEFIFNGTGFKWVVAKGPMMGKAKVYLDGVYVGRLIDLYSPSMKYNQVLSKTGLAAGNHTVAIEVSGKKNASATGTVINIDAFEVVP